MKTDPSGQITTSMFRGILAICRLLHGKTPDYCIETGTYRGDMTAEFAQIFDCVHTIELSEKWYQFSADRLQRFSNVNCHQGDSASVIGGIIQNINAPVLFYLDAHFAGGDTAFGEKEVPLIEEVEILVKRHQQDIVVIDDLRLIGSSGKSGIEGDTMYPVMEYDWTSISLGSIRKLIGGSFRNPWFFRNDKIIIFRKLSLLQGVLFRILYAGVKLRDLLAAKATVSKASKELISC